MDLGQKTQLGVSLRTNGNLLLRMINITFELIVPKELELKYH